MAKNGNGEGSIFKRKDGSWMGSVTIGRREDGKPKRQHIYGKTRKEVAEKLAVIKNDLLIGTFVEPNKVTLGDWVNAWLRDYKKNNLKPATYASYEANLQVHIKPNLGNVLLKKLTTHDIQIMESAIYNGGAVSTSLIIKIHNILHGALEQAVKNQLVMRNVAKGVSLPTHRTKEIRVLTIDEQKRFVTALEGEASRPLFMSLLYTGMRIGEALALTWNDIDLEKGTISITKNVITVMNPDRKPDEPKTMTIVQPTPKTVKSTRTIPLPGFLKAILVEHRAAQHEVIQQMDGVYINQNLVFATSTGRHYFTRNIQEKISRIAKKADIEKLSIHALRHSYATRLFEQYVPVKTVADLLGHANATITQMIYIHVMPEVKSDAVQKLEAVNSLMFL